jgi:cupin 2 domain-containing protein
MHKVRNILANLPCAIENEICETQAESDFVSIERIVSRGQATPEGEWYDQEREEWVLVIAGSACLLFEDETESHSLNAGDYILIPSHSRHRVTWTDPLVETVWLAVHYSK